MSSQIIIGITGASGVIYGIRLLEVLKKTSAETLLVISEAGKKNIEIETGWTVNEVTALADAVYDNSDMTAPVASGSFLTQGMLIAPCSVKTLSGIANSYADTLMVRAADVCLKEKKKLLLMVRETPLHAGHLDLMARTARMGAQIMPPMPAFYHLPETVQEIVDQSVGKALDYFDIPHRLFRRWEGRRPAE